MNDAPIVSHVASPEYRENIDEMTCAWPKCKRWRVDGTTKYCEHHRWLKGAVATKREENAALAAWLPIGSAPKWLTYGDPVAKERG